MTLLKICGVARREDAVALDGLADYVGFIVEPTSPRSARREDLRDLRAAVYKSKPVLVTATVPPREAVDLAAGADIPVVQHHGVLDAETYDYAKSRGVALAPVAVYRPGADLREAVRRLLALPHEYVLVDADKKSAERYEGGLKVPLSAMREVAGLGKVALAGGITPENVRLVLSLMPYMIDVASGVEKAPGVKDMEKVKALLKALGRI
ncbi:MAG: N-(5'-phosphoribosyl)anthranilate isomerase [Pyrobaculum sp.]